jgi:hypothetical protein
MSIAISTGLPAVRLLERMNSPLENRKSACADSAARRHAASPAPARPQPGDRRKPSSTTRKVGSMDIQTLIVFLIVLAAALFVGNRFRRTLLSARATTGKGGKDCGGPDCGCSPR